MGPNFKTVSDPREWLGMKTTPSPIFVAEVSGYAQLQREMHDALRAQHPEWIQADGTSPTCDSYESRLAELLVSHRTTGCGACAPFW